jgi:hypothetical protein
MEWAVLVLFASIAVWMVGALPAPWPGRADAPEAAALHEERRQLLSELAELDDDAASGRISDEDRRQGRGALAPRLRSVTESLRDLGEASGEPARGGASKEA